MQLIQQTGVGAIAAGRDVYDSTGTGMLPIQAAVTGTATFRVLGRVASDAPWIEIIEPATADYLSSIAWVPFIQLEITSGAGNVKLWIGEK